MVFISIVLINLRLLLLQALEDQNPMVGFVGRLVAVAVRKLRHRSRGIEATHMSAS
jgi:hypothetical protein